MPHSTRPASKPPRSIPRPKGRRRTLTPPGFVAPPQARVRPGLAGSDPITKGGGLGTGPGQGGGGSGNIVFDTPGFVPFEPFNPRFRPPSKIPIRGAGPVPVPAARRIPVTGLPAPAPLVAPAPAASQAAIPDSGNRIPVTGEVPSATPLQDVLDRAQELGLLERGINPDTGAAVLTNVDPDLLAFLEAPGISSLPVAEFLAQLNVFLDAADFRAGLIQDFPGFAGDLQQVPMGDILRIREFFGEDTETFDLLFENYGPIIFSATNGQLSNVNNILNQPLRDFDGSVLTAPDGLEPLGLVGDLIRGAVQLGEGIAAFFFGTSPQTGETVKLDALSAGALLGDIFQGIEQQQELERRREEGLETLEGSLEEIEASIPPPRTDTVEELRQTAREGVIDQEQFDRDLAQIDRLILRTFGERATAAGTQLAAGGFGASTFATQLREQNRGRALNAQLGAFTELTGLRNRTNAAFALENNKLAASIENQDRILDIQFKGLIFRNATAIAALQTSSTFIGTDFAGLADFFISQGESIASGRLLTNEIEPDFWRDVFDTGLQGIQAGVERVTGNLLGGF